MNSAQVLPSHLRRKAVIYIRQSTGHQVMTNQESQRMQRDMKEHALRLGWPESLIEIVEADTGTSAQTTAGRAGYKNLLSELALGEIGIVLSYESTRLSRNCSDWYPLLDLCTLNQCLIGDRDGVYDPSTPNGRLLLGMKGIVSELELHTLRGRLNAGIDNKAKRGELVQKLPVGYVRLDDGAVVKDPDLQVQESIALVFQTFLQLRTCTKVVQHFRCHGLLLPARSLTGNLLRFDPPSPQAVLRILRTPTYCGAFVFGRSRWIRRSDPTRPGYQHKILSPEEWRVVLKDHFAGYIDWDTFQRIQSILANNYAHHQRRPGPGVARDGEALLAGLAYCGHCGRQMTVAYVAKGYYRCRCIREGDDPNPHTESFRSDLIDPCVQDSFFAALTPVELDLYEAAYRRTQEQNQEVCAAQERQLQRLRYEVNRARRQYDQADPENRLVTQELERRWEAALQALAQAEQRYEQDQQTMRSEALRRIPLELRTQFAAVGQALPELWPKLPMARRKELLRCLVSKVVLRRLPSQEQMLLRIVWRGGAYTEKELTVPAPLRRTQQDHPARAERVMELVEQGHSDAQIAEQLTAKGFRSAAKNHLGTSTVARIRCEQDRAAGRDPRQRHKPSPASGITATRIAALLGVHRQWVYHHIYRGTLKLDRDPATNQYIFPNTPEALQLLHLLHDGLIQNIDFTTEHQDA